jgi:hypothetical protein
VDDDERRKRARTVGNGEVSSRDLVPRYIADLLPRQGPGRPADRWRQPFIHAFAWREVGVATGVGRHAGLFSATGERKQAEEFEQR